MVADAEPTRCALLCARTGGEMLLYLMNKDGTSKAGGGRVGDPLNRPTTIPEIPTGYVVMHTFSATVRSINVCVAHSIQQVPSSCHQHGAIWSWGGSTESDRVPLQRSKVPATQAADHTCGEAPSPPHTHTHTHIHMSPCQPPLYNTARIRTQTQDLCG